MYNFFSMHLWGRPRYRPSPVPVQSSVTVPQSRVLDKIHDITMTGIINDDRETVTLTRAQWSEVITAARIDANV